MKIKHLIFCFSAFALLVLTASACRSDAKVVKASRSYATREVKISNVSGVCCNTAIDIVYVQQSGNPYACIKAPSNVLPYVKLECRGNCLNVSYENTANRNLTLNGDFTCTVCVYAPEVTSFTVNSAGDIELKNGLHTNRDVSFKVQSAGDISCDKVKCRNLEVKVNSAGDVELDRVSCSQLRVLLNSAGDFSSDNVTCSEARLRANSAGDMDIRQLNCRGDLDALANSSGHIKLAGTCGDARYQANSTGDIKAEKMKTRNASVWVCSIGNVYCNTSGRLKVSRNTSIGMVYYKGMPTQIQGGYEGVKNL